MTISETEYNATSSTNNDNKNTLNPTDQVENSGKEDEESINNEDNESTSSYEHDDELHYHSPLNSNVVLSITYIEQKKEPLSRVELYEKSGVKFDEILQWISDQCIDYPFQILSTEYDRIYAEEHWKEGHAQIRLKFLNKEGFEKMVLSQLISIFPQNVEFKVDYDYLINPGNLFIKNIAKNVTVNELLELLKPFGKVRNCKIIQKQINNSQNTTNYGFVNYENGKDALKAIKGLNGKSVNGCNLYLNHHISKQQRLEKTHEFFTNIYIKNLPFEFTKVDMLNMFQKYGEIVSVHLPNLLPSRTNSTATTTVAAAAAAATSSVNNRQQVKYGFINFVHHNSALAAIMEMNGFEVLPQIFLQISKAQRRQDFVNFIHPSFYQTTPSIKSSSSNNNNTTKPMPGPNDQHSNVYVKGLPLNIEDSHLNKLFAPFGEIISAKVITFDNGEKSDGVSRGYGFVCFTNSEQASNSIIKMDGFECIQLELELNDYQLPKDFDNQKLHVSFAHKNNKKTKTIQHQRFNPHQLYTNQFFIPASQAQQYVYPQGRYMIQQFPLQQGGFFHVV